MGYNLGITITNLIVALPERSYTFKKGEMIYREYDSPESDKGNGHSKETDPAKMGFWLCDLLPG